MYIYEESFVISYSLKLTFTHIFTLEMLLLSSLVETGQRPGAGLTQADKKITHVYNQTSIWRFSRGGTWVSRGDKRPPCPPKCNLGLLEVVLLRSFKSC